jgi:hypothetical protein
MTDAFSSDDAQVGYRKPPANTRFKPGQSGNPKGRPKGQRNLSSEIAKAMAMPVPVTMNGRRKNVRTITALIWRLREKALGGDHKSLLLLINLIQSNQSEEKGQDSSLSALLAEDAAILRDAGLFKSRGGDHDNE